MSLRAELVRLGLRWFVKRKIGPATTLQALRRQDAFLARLVPPPPRRRAPRHLLPPAADEPADRQRADTSRLHLKWLKSHLVSNDRYARSHGKVTFPAATS